MEFPDDQAAPRHKITYATLRNDNEELHALYDAGIEQARARLGAYHQNWVGGSGRDGEGVVRAAFADRPRHPRRARSPAARARTFGTPSPRPGPPSRRGGAAGWRDRLAILRRAADLISERQMEYAALMAIEVGKSRLEALGEVEESADLIRYYADVYERNNGYVHPMDNLGDPTVRTRSVLRPFGVFAVISPFNFPMALAAGPSLGRPDGRQRGRLQARLGERDERRRCWPRPIATRACPTASSTSSWDPARRVGQEIQENPGIDGIVFTGSYEVGMALFRTFSKTWPKPCIVEMGGKNPAIVTATADLEEAADGIVRSAFGFGGQKCSANSRVYVERRVHDELVRLLVQKTEEITIGDPLASARTGSARSSTSAPSSATSRPWPTHGVTAASSSAAERLLGW